MESEWEGVRSVNYQVLLLVGSATVGTLANGYNETNCCHSVDLLD